MKILQNFLIISLLATSLRVNAQDAVSVNKGDPAPFTGILITSDLSNELRKAVVERDGIKAQNDQLNTIIKLQDDNFLHQQTKVTTLLDQNDKLAQSLGSSQSMNTWEKIAWFAGGIVAVVAGAYAVKASK